MMDTRQYDEIGRDKIREFLKDCKDIADLGCNQEKIRVDALGYDVDVGVNPDIVADLNDPKFYFGHQIEFDGICMSHLLEHIIDVRYFLAECVRGLKDEGKIAIICPDGETVPSSTLGDSANTHEMLFTPKTLKLYLENAGFKDVHTEYYDRPNSYNKTRGIFACGIK